MMEKLAVEGIEVEELEVEYIDALSVDPRYYVLSANTKDHVLRDYNGDVDEASYMATRICGTFSNPPAWAKELHNLERGRARG